MEFENFLLYENEDIKVEIAGFFHYFLNEIFIPYMKPPEIFLKSVLPFTLGWIDKNMVKIGDRVVKFCGQPPIIMPQKYATFSEPFDIFEPAQAVIAECDDLNGIEEEIEERILEDYKDIMPKNEYFYCKIFKEKIENVKGVFIFINDEEIIVMIWGYETGKDL